MDWGTERGSRAPRARWARIGLSGFFLLHFGAIAVYVLPVGTGAFRRLPDVVEPFAERASASLKVRSRYVAGAYLGITSLHQHWQLFGPEPIRWANSVEVRAYFPAEPSAEAPREARWEMRTYRVPGPLESRGPKLGRHRPWRVLSNLGYEGWGDAYRPIFASVMCSRVRDPAGRAPDGVELDAVWVQVAIPWEPEPTQEIYRQHLGGFDCPGT